MNKNYSLFVAGVLTLVVGSIIFYKSREPQIPIAVPFSEKENQASGKVEVVESEDLKLPVDKSPLNEDDPHAKLNTVSTLPVSPRYQMTEIKSLFDPVADAMKREHAPFKIQGRGSKAKIVTADGKILMNSDEKVGIYGCKVSPDGTRMSVYYGDAKYDIVTPSTGETVSLPQYPPGNKLMGFGSWDWVDDSTLIGVSGIVIPFRDDQVGTEREEPIVSRSVLYVYNLKDKTMSEVILPPALRSKIVSVSAVDATGNVQLRPEGHEASYTDASLGWFAIAR